jgi:hypothetical protein
MNQYHSIRNLSVVVHNNLFATRLNKATDDARIALLDALKAEMDDLVSVNLNPNARTKATLRAATKAVISCSRYYFARKEIDDTLAPTFWVKE